MAQSYQGWLTLARLVLDEEALQGVLLPTIADAQYQDAQARNLEPERRAPWAGHGEVAVALLAALLESMRIRFLHPVQGLFALLAGAGAASALSMRAGGVGHGFLLHVCFTLLGLIAGQLVLTLPTSLLRRAEALAYLVAGAALVACPWWGTAFEGTRQWLRLGPLQLHVASLVLPIYCVALQRLATKGWTSAVLVLTAVCLALLALQPAVPFLIVYGLTSVVALGASHRRWVNGLFLLALTTVVVTAWSHAREPGELAATALVVTVLGAVTLGALRAGSTAPAVLIPITALLATLASASALDDRLPLVGFGGSAIVEVFLLLALAARGVGPLRATTSAGRG